MFTYALNLCIRLIYLHLYSIRIADKIANKISKEKRARTADEKGSAQALAQSRRGIRLDLYTNLWTGSDSIFIPPFGLGQAWAQSENFIYAQIEKVKNKTRYLRKNIYSDF